MKHGVYIERAMSGCLRSYHVHGRVSVWASNGSEPQTCVVIVGAAFAIAENAR